MVSTAWPVQGAVPVRMIAGSRWVSERTFARIRRFTRLRAGFQVRADVHLAILQNACSIIGLRSLGTSFRRDRYVLPR